MGMIANYYYISDEDLENLKSFDTGDTIFENLENEDENTKILLDIDKMWDVLHFILTGLTIFEESAPNPLREAVIGSTQLEIVEEFIAYTDKSRIADILSALERFNLDKALKNFSMAACKEANLYPNIWDYDEEADDIKDDIRNYFQDMKEFYQTILKNKGNVMITIS